MFFYEGSLESNLQWAINKSNEKKIIIYKKYLHT
jgi:hypothetical protein